MGYGTGAIDWNPWRERGWILFRGEFCFVFLFCFFFYLKETNR
jgi:hypothetical protein